MPIKELKLKKKLRRKNLNQKRKNPNKKFWKVWNSPIMVNKSFSTSLILIEITPCTTKNGSDFVNFPHYTPNLHH